LNKVSSRLFVVPKDQQIASAVKRDASQAGIAGVWELMDMMDLRRGPQASHQLALTAPREQKKPGNLPHSGVLSAGGLVVAEDSDPAQPPSDKDARWHTEHRQNDSETDEER